MTNLRIAALSRFSSRFTLMVLFIAPALSPAADVTQERVTKANYKQAFYYSPTFLRQFVYDTTVTPRWIGKTDSFWYSYRTSKGTHFWRVDCKQATKTQLFDHVKLATQLSELLRKPVEAMQLPLARVTVNEDGTRLTFVAGDTQFQYELVAEKLSRLGKAPPPTTYTYPRGWREREQRHERERKPENQQQDQKREEQKHVEQKRDGQRRGTTRRSEQMRRGQRGTTTASRHPDYRVFSPDRKAYLFVRNHNLYLVDVSDKPFESLIWPAPPIGLGSVLTNLWTVTGGVRWLQETKAIQLTTDSEPDYSFGSMARYGDSMDDGISRPRVEWSKDSRSFNATRIDSRGVQELFLVNSLAMPRPTLERYKYPMPGEEAARKMELFVGSRSTRKLIRIKPKWKDEAYTNIHWGKSSDELRFVRRDRPWRQAELCAVNVRTGETKCLISEGFENAPLTIRPVHYLDETDEMIWWSERSGWGHYYLYDRNGKLKNAITSGLYRANNIAAVDTKKRLLFFYGNGREEGENIYYQHLYSVHLDGTGLTLLDPGDAYHQSVLSPSRQFVVDNWTRVDAAPVSYLRDITGKELMKLEEADLSRLYEIGWKMPERFVVKAADGVTDLYGNMWKPFDFEAKKKYPVIVHVYPGPQTEGVTHGFSAISSNQQMAQLGFIVIQVGHRGGTPNRSKAYGSFGYFNLRDYGLADKKAAIEQLAARFKFIDIDRVGIYGHSGGGFMSAAAVLQKPYNEFFKAAVASAGNHDNNIYNYGWAERYHGMKEVPLERNSDKTQAGTTRTGRGGGTQAEQNADTEQSQKQIDATKQVEQQQRSQVKKKYSQDDTTETRFDIKVPTNAELAANLKGALLLVHGEMDSNVHPANTMRLVDALIKANKRFDMIILPGKRHGFGDYQPYFQQRMWDFFADHLLGDRQAGADIYEKKNNHGK